MKPSYGIKLNCLHTVHDNVRGYLEYIPVSIVITGAY